MAVLTRALFEPQRCAFQLTAEGNSGIVVNEGKLQTMSITMLNEAETEFFIKVKANKSNIHIQGFDKLVKEYLESGGK